MVKITNENLGEYLGGPKPLVIDFWATWCGPCRMIAPIVEELAEAYKDQVVIAKCDVEEAEEVAAQFGIRNIPTLIFFKDGKQADKLVGAANKSKIEDKVKNLL